MKAGAAVMAGGAAGTLARAGVAEALPISPGSVPWATFAVNIAGTLLLGWLVVKVADGVWRPLVGTGFCGALTTFSTLQVQLFELGDDGHVALAALYLALSVRHRAGGRGARVEAGSAMIAWVAMAALGSLGAYARWRVTLALASRGTLAVNLTGAFAAGVLTGAGAGRDRAADPRHGLPRRFTTFSTWMVERTYLVTSIVAGLGLAWLGWLLGSAF